MNNAHWIKNIHLLDPDNYKRSACGAKMDRAYNRCPGCGREIRGVKNGGFWVDAAAFLDSEQKVLIQAIRSFPGKEAKKSLGYTLY